MKFITHVRLEGGQTVEHIVRVKGVDSGTNQEFEWAIPGSLGQVTEGDIVAAVRSNGSNVDVVVRVGRHNNKFLRTNPNSTTADNLLSLPRF